MRPIGRALPRNANMNAQSLLSLVAAMAKVNAAARDGAAVSATLNTERDAAVDKVVAAIVPADYRLYLKELPKGAPIDTARQAAACKVATDALSHPAIQKALKEQAFCYAKTGEESDAVLFQRHPLHSRLRRVGMALQCPELAAVVGPVKIKGARTLAQEIARLLADYSEKDIAACLKAQAAELAAERGAHAAKHAVHNAAVDMIRAGMFNAGKDKDGTAAMMGTAVGQ